MMNEEQIKNRNRITSTLDNCAKLLSVRKDKTANIVKTVFRIRQLTGSIRDNTICEFTINKLFSEYNRLVGILNTLRSKKNSVLPIEIVNELQEITENALHDFQSESLENIVRLNTKEYYEQQIAKEEQNINSLDTEIRQLKESGQERSVGYQKALRKKIEMTVNLAALHDMLETKKKLDDRAKALNNRVSPLSTNLNEAIKELSEEKKRLEEVFILYRWILSFVVGALIMWETILVFKLYPHLCISNYLQYIPFYLPIPLAAGLLWVCIYQMNRAQRQMVRLAGKMHRIKYNDSLLNTSINLYADMRKNEEHVAKLIDNIIESNVPKDDYYANDDKEDVAFLLPFKNVIELIKAFTHK